MSESALEAEVARLRDQVARLQAARAPDMEGFRQLNDAIVNNRLGAFVREKTLPRWQRISIVVLVTAPFVYVGFFVLYLVSSRTAHRVVGYFEEEAVISYTLYLQEIDEGRSPNVAAPYIAKHYWRLPADATLRDVVLLVRADEAHHRDINHGFASKLSGLPIDEAHVAPYPQHANEIRMKA